MRTTIFKTFMVLGLAFCATACSTSMEADAEKMAELQCEGIKLAMGGVLNALDGKTDVDRIQAHQKKVQEFSLKMMEKYDSPEEKMEFHSKVTEASLKKCM